MRSPLAVLCCAALLAPAALAHDWWFEPERCSVPLHETVPLRATVGVALQGERVLRDPKRIRRFFALDAQGERELAGAAGSEELARVELRAAGTTVVAWQSEAARLFLRAPEFEAYLREEGLEPVIERRAARGHAGRMGLEQYFRCAKTLLRTPGAPLLDRAVGLPLELLAQGDLTALAGGGTLEVELRWQGRPIEGVLVAALDRARPDAPLHARSDARGRVAFTLPRGGFWLVKAVHMVEAPPESRLDWESWWASLTFELPERAGGR